MQEKLDSESSQAAQQAKSFAVASSPEAANQQFDGERAMSARHVSGAAD
jgi:hypothetical protein